MKKGSKMNKMLLVILAAMMLSFGMILAGCDSASGNGALIGGLAGAGVGQLIGHNTTGTLIGAGVGTAGGYMIGNEMDKKKAEKVTDAKIAAAQATQTIWITNSNGSQKPVTLTQSGPGYVGPRGEYYPSLPTPEQLKVVYGF
jgi:hypothetical protein